MSSTKPKDVVRVQDHPEYKDRYLVVFDNFPDVPVYNQSKYNYSYLTLNGRPEHPQMGISMYGELESLDMLDDEHDIKWSNLPENVREHINRRAQPTKGDQGEKTTKS